MALGISMKPVVCLMFASALALNAGPSFAKAATPESADASQVQTAKLRCKKITDPRQAKKCAAIAQAEPKVARANGFLPFLAIPAVVGSAAVAAAAANGKNCGKGSNGQNNGNCPASP